MTKEEILREISKSKRMLHQLHLTKARYGISTDPSVIIGIEDTEEYIATLEGMLCNMECDE